MGPETARKETTMDDNDDRKPKVDSETGEVLPAPRRARRLLRTPEEEAEAARIRAERTELRRQEVAAIRALDPACETPGDPAVRWCAPKRIADEPNGVLLRQARVSGRGLAGSHFVVAARHYDGAGPNGGEASDSVTMFVTFRDGGGYLRRSVGVRVLASELRALIAALTAHADELDAPVEDP
jgi:hypothetical protein